MESQSSLVDRIQNADPDRVEGMFQRFAEWFYGFVQSNSTIILVTGLVVAAVLLIIGVIFAGKLVGRAIMVAVAVVIAYILIQYAPDITGTIAKAIDPKATETFQKTIETNTGGK